MMSDKNKASGDINRRNVLKSISLAGAASAGVPALVSAKGGNNASENGKQNGHADEDTIKVISRKDRNPASAHVQKVLNDSSVQAIYQDVGGFEVEAATVTVMNAFGDRTIGTELQTNLGSLAHVSKEGTTEAKLVLQNPAEVPTIRQKFSDSSHGFPAETKITVLANDSATKLVRSVSDKERARLKEAVDYASGEFFASYDADIDGFSVRVVDSSEMTNMNVATGEQAISAENVEVLATTYGCTSSCLQCIAGLVGKAGCYGSCYLAGSLVTGALCLLCLTTSSVSLISCGDCSDCF